MMQSPVAMVTTRRDRMQFDRTRQAIRRPAIQSQFDMMETFSFQSIRHDR